MRLDGPVERHVAQASVLEEIAPHEAERRLKQNDEARERYVRHYYGADGRDPRLYHLVIDATAIPLDACVELVAAAARAREHAVATT